MRTLLTSGLAAAAILSAFVITASPKPALADQLKKAENAAAYTIRKDAVNVSIDTHRGANHNSVVHPKRHYFHRTIKRTFMLTPGGHLKPLRKQPVKHSTK